MLKVSTTIKQMLLGLNPEIITRAKELTPELVVSKGSETTSVYKVDDHEVTISLKDKDNPMVNCTCSFWKYQGPEFHAKEGEYLLGKPQGTATKPTSKDPEGVNKVCKHVYATLQTIVK